MRKTRATTRATNSGGRSMRDAPAMKLAQLDREERDWQARLNNYAGARASNASAEQLEQLRGRLFSAPEQLRIEAALATRPQPAAVQR